MVQNVSPFAWLSSVTAAALIFSPFHASQRSARPSRTECSTSVKLESRPFSIAALINDATCGQNSRACAGSTQISSQGGWRIANGESCLLFAIRDLPFAICSTERDIKKGPIGLRVVGVGDDEGAVVDGADIHRAVADLGRGVGGLRKRQHRR